MIESLLISAVTALIALGLGYLVIRAAVRAALADHYKTVRRFEVTGKWHQGTDDSTPQWTSAERTAAEGS